MRLLVLVAAVMAFLNLALMVPDGSRDIHYWVAGGTLLVALGLLGSDASERR